MRERENEGERARERERVCVEHCCLQSSLSGSACVWVCKRKSARARARRKMSEGERVLGICACILVCQVVCLCIYWCVCPRETDKASWSERGSEIARERESERAKARAKASLCAVASARASKKEKDRERERERNWGN